MWSARCSGTGTAGAEGGPGKRTGSNPGTAPRTDPTPTSPTPTEDTAGRSGEPDSTGGRSAREQYRELRHALLADKRAAIIGLRDARLIDDIVLHRIQSRLDAEESRLVITHEPEPE